MAAETWTTLSLRHYPVAATAVVLIAVLAIRYLRSQWQPKLKIPVATVVKNDWKATMLQATTEYPDEPFLLPSFQPRVILPNRVMDEVRSLPEDRLSLRKEVYTKMHGKYTGLGAEHPLGVAAIKTELTNNIGRMLPEIQEEAVYALHKHIGPCPDWTETFLLERLMKLSALTNGRMFVGLPLSRDPEWVKICLTYTRDVVGALKAVSIVNVVVPWLRDVIAPFLPQVRKLKADKRRGAQALRPIIERMVKAPKESESGSSQLNLLSWMLHQVDARTGKVDFQLMAHEQLFAGFASIHNTAITVTNVLFDLAANPHYIPEIRAEIEEVLSSEPDRVIRKISLPKLRKLDSLLRETQRMSPASLTSIQRLVEDPNGIKLSSGHVLPRGTSIGFMHPLAPWVKTPPNVKTDYVSGQPSLEVFYPFRFSEIRALPGQENGHQFSQTSHDNINFGHGPMACPGRFFAGAEIKCILIEILTRYDVALGPGGEGAGGPSGLTRPANVVYPNLQCMPDFSRPVYLRERSRETIAGS